MFVPVSFFSCPDVPRTQQNIFVIGFVFCQSHLVFRLRKMLVGVVGSLCEAVWQLKMVTLWFYVNRLDFNLVTFYYYLNLKDCM